MKHVWFGRVKSSLVDSKRIKERVMMIEEVVRTSMISRLSLGRVLVELSLEDSRVINTMTMRIHIRYLLKIFCEELASFTETMTTWSLKKWASEW